jgi:hypothetical protein
MPAVDLNPSEDLIEAGTPYKSKVGEEIFANASTS